MGKTHSSVAPDRKQQLRDLLGGRDVLPEKYLELAFQQEDVDRVDLFKFSGGWNPSKVDDFKEGFDPTTVSSYILEKFGPGRYRLSVVCDGEYMLHKSYAFGEMPDTPGSPQVRAQHPPGTVLDAHGNPVTDRANSLTRDIADGLRVQGLLSQQADIIADREARQGEREVRPAQLMITAMTGMMDLFKQLALKPPAPTTDPMTAMLPILLKMMDSQQAVFLAMINQKQGQQSGGLKEVAEGLQLLEKTLTGRIGELMQTQDGAGTDWTKVAEVAAPMLERAMGVLEAAISRGNARPALSAPRPIMPPPRPASPSSAHPSPEPANPVVMNEEMPVKIHPDPDVDKALHEAADLGVEMLRSRDWKSLLKLLELNFPDFLEQIDLDANPIVYIQWLKRLNPKFDELRGEFTEFVKWLDQQTAPEPEPDPRDDLPAA